jgi:hypothetical protein
MLHLRTDSSRYGWRAHLPQISFTKPGRELG